MATWITAHSGCDGTKDNSMEFIRYALKTKADVFEMDIREMGGRLVICHDEPDPMDPDTYTDLDVVFETAKKNPLQKMNCDLKQPDLEEAVLKCAQKHGAADRLIYTGTVSIQRMKKLPANTIQVFLNIEEYIPDVFSRCANDPSFIPQAAKDICRICTDGGITGVNTNYLIATDEFLEICNENMIKVSVWTVNDAEEIKRFLEADVANITTRNLKKALKTAGR